MEQAMIGEQQTGAIDGVVISAVAHEGLTVQVKGGRGRLAVLDEAGNVVAAGDDLAAEVESVAIQAYRNLLKGTGHLRVLSAPIQPANA